MHVGIGGLISLKYFYCALAQILISACPAKMFFIISLIAAPKDFFLFFSENSIFFFFFLLKTFVL